MVLRHAGDAVLSASSTQGRRTRFTDPAFADAEAWVAFAQAPDTYAIDDQLQRRRTHEEQLDLVLQSVRLHILEKLRYEIDDPDAGRVVEVKSEILRP
jgi:hypothetical protein